MRNSALIVLLVCGTLQSVNAQNCWTNTAGRAFQAELASMTETHALFVMQDGTTNRLALAALNEGSRESARHLLGMPEIPVRLLATFQLCQKDLSRINNLKADDRLDDLQWSDARAKILAGFKTMYQQHKLLPADYAPLEARLLSGK